MARLLDEFVGFIDDLNAKGIDYAVCGGWAMAIHGFLRATTDIDFLILAKDLDVCRKILAEHDFDIEGLPLDFDGGKTRIRRVSKVDSDTKTLVTVDFLLVTESTADVWKDRQKVRWDKGEYWVVSPKGMIVMKEKAGRDKDLIDLKYLRGLENES